jgi:hypothetical protein
MRRKIRFALASVALSLSAIGGVSAQQVASTIPAVLQLCPADSAGRCVPVVQAFVAQRELGARLDADLVDLVAALAGAAQDPRVTRPICLDIADGMRVAGEAMVDTGLRDQTFALADALCLGGFETAAISTSAPGGSSTESLSPTTDGGNPVVPAPVVPDPVVPAPVVPDPVVPDPDDTDECESECDDRT